MDKHLTHCHWDIPLPEMITFCKLSSDASKREYASTKETLRQV